MKNITILGDTHLALVYSAGFLSVGCEVTLVLTNREACHAVKNLDFPVFEPGLSEIFKNGFEEKLKALSLETVGIELTDTIVLAEDITKTDKGADTKNLYELVEKISGLKKEPFDLIVSTQVPVGTLKILETQTNLSRHSSTRMSVAYVPEFLRLGTAIKDILSEDYVHIVGSDHLETRKKAEDSSLCLTIEFLHAIGRSGNF